MYMKKSVGPVGEMTVGHCLIQMRSGGSKAGPRISEDLAFCTTKNGKNNKIADDGIRIFNPSVINQVL